MTELVVILCYLAVLLVLGLFSNRLFRGTSKDYFVASHSIGPFLLLMSIFGTTMTAFALVGSTGEAFERGIGVFGLMASISCLIHILCFFLIGIRVWGYGKRLGFVTQIQFFRARFESNLFGYLLFPILVGLVVPYLLIGIVGAAKTVQPATAGAFPEHFNMETIPGLPAFMVGGIPPWITGLVVCLVVLAYVFAGGSRGTAWANTFQTIIFMGMGVVAFYFIVSAMGGVTNAAKVPAYFDGEGQLVQGYQIDKENHRVTERNEPLVIARVTDPADVERVAGMRPHLVREPVTITYQKKSPADGSMVEATREIGISQWMFLTYIFVPLSVGMFPHLFQHWLTARSAKSFRLTVVAHPLCILIVWVPCILIGTWASGLMVPGTNSSAVLGNILKDLVESPVLTGLLTAGVLAAIMSSLDSQFLCLGTIFTTDVVVHALGEERVSDTKKIWIARGFIIGIVGVTYWLAMANMQSSVFDLAVWCFAGFSSLTPLVFAAIYWKGATKLGAYASVLAAMGVWAYFFIGSGGGAERLVGPGITPVTFSFAAGAAAMFFVSLVTPKPSDETIRKFFPKTKNVPSA